MSSRDVDLERRLRQALGDTYALEQPIGQGGFAVVYAAHDRALNRPVAIKVLRPELAGAAAIRERFRREAEAIAGVRHPHVIPVYAVGEGPGLAWFVMPLVAGESLRDWLEREGRLPLDAARRILIEAASALAAAHRAGLVHRDIKPDNILLDGEDRRVLVTDFGIAKAIGGDAPTADLTATGVVVGTPHYMSPEQASGERSVDHRSDLYSLGVVAYQLLAGDLPFDAPSAGALLVKHLTEDPVPVARRRPDCPADLAAAVMRCLEKDPARRWPTAGDLLTTLAPSAPVAVAPPGSAAGPRAPDALHRFRRVAVGATALALLLVGIDLALGRALLGPPAALVAAFIVAAQYGRLWTAGYHWRDVLGRATLPTARTGISVDSAELGPHRDVVAAMRNDRAVIVASLTRVPRAERGVVADVLPTLDGLIARAFEMARQLYGLERQIDPGPEELERRIAAARTEPSSPGRDQRLAILDKRLDAVRALAARRARVAADLARCAAATTGARAEIERAGPAAGATMLESLRAALAGGADQTS